MKYSKSLYRRAKGKSVNVQSRLAFSDRARKAYKTMFRIVFPILAVEIFCDLSGIIDSRLMLISLFVSVVALFVVPLLITLKDKGKEAVIQEINQSKVKTVVNYDYKESIFGNGYNNNKIAIVSNGDGRDAATGENGSLSIKDDIPMTVIDETDSSQ